MGINVFDVIRKPKCVVHNKQVSPQSEGSLKLKAGTTVYMVSHKSHY